MLILAMRFPTRNWAGSIRRDPHRSGTVIDMTEKGPGTGDEGATILSFPMEQEAPRSARGGPPLAAAPPAAHPRARRGPRGPVTPSACHGRVATMRIPSPFHKLEKL